MIKPLMAHCNMDTPSSVSNGKVYRAGQVVSRSHAIMSCSGRRPAKLWQPMIAKDTPICDFGWPAPEFALPDPSGAVWSLEDCRGARATLVMFLSNHCPFVKASLARLIGDLEVLKPAGVAAVGIMSNDISRFPEDAPDEMQRLADAMAFPFPYLVDESQQTASEYGAVCTPDYFGFNQDLELQYRGRLDAGRTETPPADCPRELQEAMLQIAQTGHGPDEQIPSVGCSIKWKI